MANQYQVNIQITAGADFYQTFTLAEADFTPSDITGYVFYAQIAKHARSIDVLNEENYTKYKTIPLETEIVDAKNGVYAIKMDDETSQHLEEGKYVYSVVSIAPDEYYRQEVVQGLAFVDRSFGYFAPETDE